MRGGEGNKFIGAGRRMGGDGMEIFYKLVLNESGEGKIFSGPDDEPLQCIDLMCNAIIHLALFLKLIEYRARCDLFVILWKCLVPAELNLWQ